MKKWFADPKNLFTLLMIAALIAIAAGMYLGVALGMQVQASVTVLSVAGLLLWTAAWVKFLAMCLRLSKGESAFTPATGKTLSVIGGCMVGLAAVALMCALIAASRNPDRAPAFRLIEQALLPGFFLAVAAAAKILRDLLTHAMAIEEEQEGVV